MKASKNGSLITITLESDVEVDIMACCLNWGVSAMSKSKFIDTVKDDETTRDRCKIEKDMWQEFTRVQQN